MAEAAHRLSPLALDFPPITLTLARWLASKAVKARWAAFGLKVHHIEASELARAARTYLSEHPELIEQAAETVRNHPKFRTLAEREQRQRKANHP
jgi:hypothetical protein